MSACSGGSSGVVVLEWDETPKLLEGSGPLAFERSFNSSEDLMKRLSQTAEFRGDAASVSNVTWSPDRTVLGRWRRGLSRQPSGNQEPEQLKQTIDMVPLS